MSQYDKIIIKSKMPDKNNIIIYKNDYGDRKMQFDTHIDIIQNVFQSSYNIYDLDMFNLKYLNFVILLFLYTDVVNSFLLIGLGGGHLPAFIKSKNSEINIDVVELNQQVLEGAIEMGYSLNNVIIENGINYIKRCIATNKKYDVIVIDLDGEESYKDFIFSEIRNILEDNGTLVINSYAQSGKSELKAKIKQSFFLIKHFINGNSNVFLCKPNIDMFEEMLEEITIEKLESNSFMSTFKYKNKLLEVLNNAKISITLN
jgi:hypothetical protein